MADTKTGSKNSTSRLSIQSVEIGARVLFTLAQFSKATSLTELSRKLGQDPGNVRRYLVSLVNSGLVVQNSRQKYDLGPACVRLGALAMARIPYIEIAREEARRLSDTTDCTVVILVWGSNGPVIIDQKESTQAISLVGRIGSTLSPVYSVSGRVFLAYRGVKEAKKLFDQELRRSQRGTSKSQHKNISFNAFKEILDDIRSRGMGRVQGDYTPGLDALGVPAMDADDRVQVVLTLIGQHGNIDVSWSGKPATELKKAAKRLSIAYGNVVDPNESGDVTSFAELPELNGS